MLARNHATSNTSVSRSVADAPSRFAPVDPAVASNRTRPKLLLLAWNFPPVQAIASVRTWNVAKYLTRLGWDVTVVTPKTELWRNLENVEKARADLRAEGIRKISTEHGWRFLSPLHLTCRNDGIGWFAGGVCRRLCSAVGIDDAVGWIKAAERACDRIRPDEVDLILASGPPFSAFTLAEKLSKKLHRPYALDYRDPWTVTDIIPGLQHLTISRERKLLAGAAAVIMVSQSWAAELNSRFNIGSKLQVVTNGYDPEELKEVEPHDFGHFAIVYAGIFYPPERVVTPILDALKRLDIKGGSHEWFFHYYGEHNSHVHDEAVRLGISNRVKLHGRVPRSVALSAIRGANVALVITSVSESAPARITGWVPAKLFEILGVGTPILLVAPPGSDAQLIADSGGWSRRFSGNDITEIVSFIEQQMHGGPVEKRDSHRYAWKEIAVSFDKHLRNHLPGSTPQAISN